MSPLRIGASSGRLGEGRSWRRHPYLDRLHPHQRDRGVRCKLGRRGRDRRGVRRPSDGGESLAREVCSAHEQAQLRAAPPEARKALFMDLWTLKEAYLKALGVGIPAGRCTRSPSISAGRTRSSPAWRATGRRGASCCFARLRRAGGPGGPIPSRADDRGVDARPGHVRTAAADPGLLWLKGWPSVGS